MTSLENSAWYKFAKTRNVASSLNKEHYCLVLGSLVGADSSIPLAKAFKDSIPP